MYEYSYTTDISIRLVWLVSRKLQEKNQVGELARATISYDILGEVPGVVEVMIDKKIENYSRQSYKKEGKGK